MTTIITDDATNLDLSSQELQKYSTQELDLFLLALAEKIQTLKKLQLLNLSKNTIAHASAEALKKLAISLGNNTAIRTLKLKKTASYPVGKSHTLLSNENRNNYVNFLIEILEKNKFIEVAELNGNDIGRSNKDRQRHLIKTIAMHPRLKIANLSDNGFGYSDDETMSALAGILKDSVSLEEFNVNNNQIGNPLFENFYPFSKPMSEMNPDEAMKVFKEMMDFENNKSKYQPFVNVKVGKFIETIAEGIEESLTIKIIDIKTNVEEFSQKDIERLESALPYSFTLTKILSEGTKEQKAEAISLMSPEERYFMKIFLIRKTQKDFSKANDYTEGNGQFSAPYDALRKRLNKLPASPKDFKEQEVDEVLNLIQKTLANSNNENIELMKLLSSLPSAASNVNLNMN